MDASEHILRQLRWIKWLVALLAFCFVVITCSFIWFVWQVSIAFQEDETSSTSFAARGATLLEEGKEQEVLKLSAAREQTFSKDPLVYWYRGKAHYQLGHLDEALKAMRHLHELDPSWRESHTDSYIKALETESQDGNASSFWKSGSKLLWEGKEQDVLKLCEVREKRFPKDPDVYWHRGVAHFQLGQFEEALKAMHQAYDLAPTWRETSTAPYIKAIEQELAKGL